ncbi:TerB family tellurite resistance protein [Psychromonas ossibalaenae]|uniref:tellurite resistance TerB family protein n=1 Tax=Psychromonas ossibalaenae TaxID=444922 RepID=UPI00037BA5B0|nr:TerB family tellurite resistance protein [Psychromonas ossibalaenae]
MIAKIKDFLNSMIETDASASEEDHRIAIVSLLCEVCNANHSIADKEEEAVVRTLSKLLHIDTDKAQELLEIGKEEIKSSNSLFDFTSQLSHLDSESRIRLISAMWEVAYADNHLDPIEESIIRKVAALIYVGHNEFIRTKLAVMPS